MIFHSHILDACIYTLLLYTHCCVAVLMHIRIMYRYTYIYIYILTYTLPETSIAPENRPSQKNRILFQSSIFNCYFTFRECNVQLNLLCITCFPIASRHWQSYEASSWSLCLRPAGRLCESEDQIWQGHFVCAHMEFGPRNSHSRNLCTRHQFFMGFDMFWYDVRFGAR